VGGAVVLASHESVPSASHLAWAAFAGAIGVVGLALFYRALAVGAMGIVGPITATAAIVPMAYGLARGERPSTLQSAGIALAIVGVVAASLERTPDRRGRQFGAGVGLSLAAALCFGWALIGLSRAAAGGIAWSILTMRAVAVPLVLVALVASRPRLQVSSRSVGLLIAVGVGDTVATLLYSTATTRGLLSVVVVLASLYPIVMVVLARVLLAERVARAQLAGVAVALAGVALISAG
jgi:drug/metabolite transporter (DMT)-like permease